MAGIDDIVEPVETPQCVKSVLAVLADDKSFTDNMLDKDAMCPSEKLSVLAVGEIGNAGNFNCGLCGSGDFWTDRSGTNRCENCNPPISELYVVSRNTRSGSQADDSKEFPPSPSVHHNNDPQSFPKSIFTEHEWDLAGERLLRKFAEREANAIACKKTQDLTDEQNELIAWAKSQIELPINSSITSEPITLARHHTIANPIKFITWAVDHLRPRQFRRRCRPPDEPTSVQYPPDTDEVLKTLAELRRVVEGKQ